VGGLIVGGNNHIPKPFALAEVVARVHRMIRRVGAGPEDNPVLRFAGIALDEGTCVVTRAGSAISLTPQEFTLLRFFLLNPRRVHSKSQLIHNVWRYDFRGCNNVVPVCVGNLRRKLEAAGPPVIHTIRAKGYVLR
jgi:two-component system OmpR family response regulator